MNMNNLMAQAQKIQKDMEKKQKEIYETEYEGKSELVDIVVMGDKTIKKVTIKAENTLEKEDIEILEDMIKIALNDAFAKINSDIDKKMGMYGKNLGGLF